MPPLRTPLADGLGFHHDGDLGALVRRTLAEVAERRPAFMREPPRNRVWETWRARIVGVGCMA